MNGAGGFGRRAHEPSYWLKQAKELDTAAMLIWSAICADLESLSRSSVGTAVSLRDVPHVNLGGIFWLNAGLALENLFKGIIVQDDPSSVVNGTITKKLKTHNLFALAKLASLELDPNDAFFLWVGSECVEWAGRYPCAIKPEKSSPPVFSEGDVIAYKGLFDRLISRFDGSHSKNVIFTRLV